MLQAILDKLLMVLKNYVLTFQEPESTPKPGPEPAHNRPASKVRIPGLSEVISEKFSAYNLAGKVLKFLRKLIANRKFKLAIAIKSAKLGKKN